MVNSPPPPELPARPRLSADELHQCRWLLGGVLTLLAVATVGYMEVEAWWLMALTAVVSLLTTLRPTLPARVPRFAHAIAFPLMAAFFALDLWLRSELLPAMVRLDMLLLLYRALVYRQRRDDLQVIVLGLFLVVVAGVLTVSLMFAAQILLYTGTALLFLLVLTLLDSTSPPPPSAGAAGESNGAPPWAAHANWLRLGRRVVRVMDWRIGALSVALFVGLVAASALLFLLIPRFQLENGMFLDRFITKKARTGFSDSIKFGDVSEIQQDTSVALHVDVSDPGQIPLAPYWRMLVLNEYRNGTFRMSPDLRRHAFDPHLRSGMTMYGAADSRRNRAVWRLYLEPGVSRYLPLLARFRRLTFAEAQTFQSAERIGLLALTKDPVAMTAYQVEGFDVSERLRDLPGGYYSGLPDSLTAGEAAALRQLAAEASGGGETSTAEFAARVCAWLRTRHPYSLSPRIPAGAGDPLVRWVGSQGQGHCELFAGSFVLLARAAGYPARVVTGFRGGSWNAFATNSFTIRNSDAHAWAEIYDRRSGSWLRADPLELPATAANGAVGGDPTLAQRTDHSWAARMDSLRVFWYRRVVSFDEQTQVQTLKVAKELAQSALGRLRMRLHVASLHLQAWWHKPWDARRYGGVALALLAGVGMVFAWRPVRLAWLQWRSAQGRGRRDDPVRREAGRWLRRLQRANTAASEDPVIGELQRLRYGAPGTWPVPAKVFRRARVAARQAKSTSRLTANKRE